MNLINGIIRDLHTERSPSTKMLLNQLERPQMEGGPRLTNNWTETMSAWITFDLLILIFEKVFLIIK
jgi:hypothetical protein